MAPIAALNPHIQLRIFLPHDQHYDLMQPYLFRGQGQSIPAFGFFDENFHEFAKHTGGRPQLLWEWIDALGKDEARPRDAARVTGHPAEEGLSEDGRARLTSAILRRADGADLVWGTGSRFLTPFEAHASAWTPGDLMRPAPGIVSRRSSEGVRETPSRDRRATSRSYKKLTESSLWEPEGCTRATAVPETWAYPPTPD
jgi:hypothetical protein